MCAQILAGSICCNSSDFLLLSYLMSPVALALLSVFVWVLENIQPNGEWEALSLN